jgi:hypothetical protein
VLMRRAWDLFGTHLRKQNDVADARAVGQQHHEPVDADAGAAVGGKPYSSARM